MISKQALIVDDSKSARFVLKRMLSDLNLEVDAAESAADALDYLKYHKPDVIFMDHMMPGMDGLEALTHIKNNARTATIPVMMYTTKGGDVYLSQARALGAVGVIQKTISPVDLQESLLSLGLIDEASIIAARKQKTPVVSKTDEKPIEEKYPEKSKVLDEYINDLHRLMDDQTVELHRSMWLGIESVSHEIFNRLNSELEGRFDKIQSEPKIIPEHVSEHGNKVTWPIYMVSALLVVSVIYNVKSFTDIAQLETKLVVAERSSNDKPEIKAKAGRPPYIEHRASRLAMVDAKRIIVPDDSHVIDEIMTDIQHTRIDFIKWAHNKVIEYPYNELALNDRRLSSIEALINIALETEFTGTIKLQTHVGRFCLSSDQQGNYMLADDELPITACEFIGNLVQPIDEPATHQSLSFANYLSDMSFLTNKGIYVEVTNVPRTLELLKYPELVKETNVKEWNKAAQVNNRITIKLAPALKGDATL